MLEREHKEDLNQEIKLVLSNIRIVNYHWGLGLALDARGGLLKKTSITITDIVDTHSIDTEIILM